MSEFAFVADIPVRYRDLDPMKHVNNVVYGTYLEEARIAYLDAVLEEPMGSRTFVLAHLELDFQSSITHDDDLQVAVRAETVGTTSLGLAYEVRAGERVAATGETAQVHVDGDQEPTPLPDAWRENIRSFEPGLAADASS